MQATIQTIKKELKDCYPPDEVRGFIRLIFEKVCGYSYTQLVLRKDDVLPATEKAQIKQIVEQLKKFEPIQYILGETVFYGLKLRVNPVGVNSAARNGRTGELDCGIGSETKNDSGCRNG